MNAIFLGSAKEALCKSVSKELWKKKKNDTTKVKLMRFLGYNPPAGHLTLHTSHGVRSHSPQTRQVIHKSFSSSVANKGLVLGYICSN